MFDCENDIENRKGGKEIIRFRYKGKRSLSCFLKNSPRLIQYSADKFQREFVLSEKVFCELKGYLNLMSLKELID